MTTKTITDQAAFNRVWNHVVTRRHTIFTNSGGAWPATHGVAGRSAVLLTQLLGLGTVYGYLHEHIEKLTDALDRLESILMEDDFWEGTLQYRRLVLLAFAERFSLRVPLDKITLRRRYGTGYVRRRRTPRPAVPQTSMN